MKKLIDCTIPELFARLATAESHDEAVAIEETLREKGYEVDDFRFDDDDIDDVEEPIDLEVGFDPYEGGYTWDC